MSERGTAKQSYEPPTLIVEGGVADLTAGIDTTPTNDEALGGLGSQ